MSVLSIYCKEAGLVIPKYAGGGAYTIYSNENKNLLAGERTQINSGLVMAFPITHFASLSTSRKELKTLSGVIDADFRGDMQVIGIPTADLEIRKGEEIAMMVLLEIMVDDIVDGMNYKDLETGL